MEHKITFTGFVNDKEWKHYSWLITIGNETFNYKTGIGHAIKRFNRDNYRPNKVPGGKKAVIDAITDSMVFVPEIDEVLSCLLSDADFGNESFNDFCDNLGYSSDSIKAFDVYRSCMDTGKRLRVALGENYTGEVGRIRALRDYGKL